MADPETAPPDAAPKKKGLLLPLALTLVLGGAGFASSYLGYWSPLALLSPAEATEHPPEGPIVEFVEVPRVQIVLSVTPPRMLNLSAVIETENTDAGEVRHLMPRVSDTFNTFLSEIDPAAFDKRGVLEIVRSELVTRTRLVVGEKPVRDVLITEFRLQ